MTNEFEPFTLPKKPLCEAQIERAVCEYAKSKGILVYKFSSPAHVSVPDRMFLRDGEVIFIEFKAPGNKATATQLREHDRLRNQEFEVHVIDDIENGKELIDEIF